MAANPLLRLRELGQSVWLDYIERGLIVNGGLAPVVAEWRAGREGAARWKSLAH